MPYNSSRVGNQRHPRSDLRRILIVLGGLICLIGVGCQSQHAAPPVVADQQNSAPEKPATTEIAPSEPQNKVTPADNSEEIWFDDPLQLAGDFSLVDVPGTATSDLSNPAAKPPQTETASTEQSPAPDRESSVTGEWTSYIAAEQLVAESKKLRNQLQSMLRTQAAYNENFEVIKIDGAVLAALAVIAPEMKDEINWKSKSAYIRDYGQQLTQAAQGLGKPNYEKTRATWENLQSVFSGSIPVGANEPPTRITLPEVAPRVYLMKRMKLAFTTLKRNINTAEQLKSQTDEALLETMMLAAMTKLVSSPEYTSADEPDYQAFMREILTNCQSAVEAVNDPNFEQFSTSLNAIDKACLNCHSAYKE